MCLSITQDFLGSADFKLTDLVTDGGGKVELDLLSLLLYTLAKCGQYYSLLFDQALHRLESVDPQSVDTLSAVRVLDAIARLNLPNQQLAVRLAHAVCLRKDAIR